MKRFFLLRHKLVCLITSVLLVAQALSQSNTGSEIIRARFDQYRNNILQEKIYAHTDKEFYLSGEILWFNLFYVDASFHKPLDVSKLAYVELLNKEHQSLVQAKVTLTGGGGSGSVVLPADLPSDNYYFRAYTNWMKNFDADFYFEKSVRLVNTLTADAISRTKSSREHYDIQFFPEGGNLINNMSTKLAFHAINSEGKGINFSGVIVTKNGDTIANFQPQKFGMGSIDFIPKISEEYEAIVTTDDGQVIKKKLPAAMEHGYSLSLKKSGESEMVIKVGATNYFNGKPVYVLIHARQQVALFKEAIIQNNQVEFAVNEKDFIDGISQITVFDTDKKPVCERLYFKKPVHQLSVSARLNKEQYESRKKVEVNVASKNEIGKEQVSKMSVAVYQVDSTMAMDEDILSYLYLRSDLKGTIEAPSFYFSNDPDVDKMRDNLMLTQGWRRFKWEELLKAKRPVIRFAPELEGHIVTAKLTDKRTGSPANGIKAYLSIPDTGFQFYSAKTNVNGEARFYTKNFVGRREVFSQAENMEEAYRVTLNSPFSEQHSTRLLSAFSYADLSGKILQVKSVNMQVQNAYTATSMNQYKAITVPYSPFYKPTERYLLDDYTRFTTMEDVLREYVREIVVNKQNNKLLLSLIRKDPAGLVDKHRPLVLIDGVALLEDYNKIFAYDPLKVKDLQIVNRRYFLGQTQFDGIVNFRTYKGYPDAAPLDASTVVVDYEGLQLQREFYSPVYETQNQITSRMPDFRNLLFWSPVIKTSDKGQQSFSFYTSDLPGKYLVVVQALSDDGTAGSATTTFDVINPSFAEKN